VTTQREGTSHVGERSASDRVRGTSERVRVWSEVSLTVAITTNPAQYVKVTFGRETLARDNSTAVKRAEERLYSECEEIVQRRVEELTQLIETAMAG
jgi:hypothetical protein